MTDANDDANQISALSSPLIEDEEGRLHIALAPDQQQRALVADLQLKTPHNDFYKPSVIDWENPYGSN